MKAIINGKIIYDKHVLENHVLLFNDKITELVSAQKVDLHDKEVIDAKGNFVSAGFIDIHIHGYGEKDTMDGTVDAIETIAEGICKNGVTSFLATTMTMEKEAITNALEAVRQAKEKGVEGAEVLGVHMEGPYVNVAYKGAQNEAYIIPPNADEIGYVKAHQDIIKLVTLAPELEGAKIFIKEISQTTDIALSMGHSSATFEEAMEGIHSGISHTTHLFNAMTPLHHRNPGVVGAALASDVSCEMICDTIHVHPGIYPLVLKAKAQDKFVLVTDCMCAGGCQDGDYTLGGQQVVVEKGSARLKDGTLAGSTLKLNEALHNVMTHTKQAIEEVIPYATINPAKVIGVDAYKGTLEVGKDADITIFNEQFVIQYTLSKGSVIYENDKEK